MLLSLHTPPPTVAQEEVYVKVDSKGKDGDLMLFKFVTQGSHEFISYLNAASLLLPTPQGDVAIGEGWIEIKQGCRLPVIPPPYEEDGCNITPLEVPILCHQDESIVLDWYNNTGMEWFALKEYTHWQPLPQPPSSTKQTDQK